MKRKNSTESTYRDHDNEIKELIVLMNEVEARLAPGEEINEETWEIISNIIKPKPDKP
jgi:hypothetical protein